MDYPENEMSTLSTNLKKEENKMADSGFSTSDAVLTAAMSGGLGGRGGYGGGGGGQWGGGYGGGGHGPFASPTSNAVRIEAHAAQNAASIENLLDQNQFAATNNNITNGNNRLTDANNINVNRVSDQQFRAELRNSDQHNEIIREMNANARAADKCCCDTQKAIAEAAKDAAKCCCDATLEACKNTAALLADGALTRSLMTTTALDAANAKIVQLETINALSKRHG